MPRKPATYSLASSNVWSIERREIGQQPDNRDQPRRQAEQQQESHGHLQYAGLDREARREKIARKPGAHEWQADREAKHPRHVGPIRLQRSAGDSDVGEQLREPEIPNCEGHHADGAEAEERETEWIRNDGGKQFSDATGRFVVRDVLDVGAGRQANASEERVLPRGTPSKRYRFDRIASIVAEQPIPMASR